MITLCCLGLPGIIYFSASFDIYLWWQLQHFAMWWYLYHYICREAFLVNGADSVNVLPVLHHCRECCPGKQLHRADHWWFRPLLVESSQGRNWFRKEVRSEVELRDVCSARAFHDCSDLSWPGCGHLPGQSWWNHNYHPIFILILQEVATGVDAFPAEGWRLQSSRRKRVKQVCWKSAPLFSLQRWEFPIHWMT